MRKGIYLLVVCLLLLGAGTLLAQDETDNDAEESPCEPAFIENPTPSYYIGLGESLFDQGRFTEAIIVFTCAIELQPDYAPAYADRGFAYAALLDVDQALADFEAALNLDETLLAAYNNRGILYTNQGNFGLAINDFTLVVSLDPNNAVAYNNRGVVHAAEGNYDLALADFNLALELDPTYAQPYASIAAVYSALASINYQQFVETAGDNARLPAGTPTQVLSAIDDNLREGTFTTWLALLSPAP